MGLPERLKPTIFASCLVSEIFAMLLLRKSRDVSIEYFSMPIRLTKLEFCIVKDVRAGKYTLDRILELSIDFENKMKSYYELSRIQYSVDWEEINRFQKSMLKRFWEHQED